MIVVGVIAFVALIFLLAGLVERGYLTRVWVPTSRLGRGRRYGGD